jgi:hypothetical protein
VRTSITTGAGVRLITGVVSFVSDDDEHDEMIGKIPNNAAAIRKDGFLIPPRVSDISSVVTN